MRHLCIRSVVNSKNAIIVLLAFYRMYLTFFNDPYMSKFLNVLKHSVKMSVRFQERAEHTTLFINTVVEITP